MQECPLFSTPFPAFIICRLFDEGHSDLCEMVFCCSFDLHFSKSWLKAQHSENEDHGIWSHHFMANRCRNSGTVTEFILGGSKITADGDCNHEIKRYLLGRKVMTNLDGIFKSKDITLSTKVHLVKATVFPVVMSGCESWTVKKAERRRINAFELWCWRRLLRVHWTARRSN